jgi:cytochrome c biogenesis protein CcmG/thiol:disulfide interchange protein DsbE
MAIKDTKREGKYFLNRLGNPFDFIVFDEQGKLGLELGVYATPETFIVPVLQYCSTFGVLHDR